MSLESVTAEWMQQLTKVGQLYTLAFASKAGLLDAYFGNIIALYEMTQGGLMYSAAATGTFAMTAGLPAVTAVGVWVALGSGYYQARQEVKKEETMSGFSQGFVMAIIGWKWNHIISRFHRPFFHSNHFDEAMDSIRVDSYHEGLKKGYLAGIVLPEEAKKQYSRKIRQAGKVHGPKEWSRNDTTARNQQISYVIEMASTALRHHIIKAD